MPNGLRDAIGPILALSLPGCLADGPATAGGPQGGPATLTSRFDGGTCGPLGNLGGVTPRCDGFVEYTDCLARECLQGYDVCLGESWPSGDYSGGPCEELMDCISGSPDRCEHACTPGGACADCLVGQLSICETYCASVTECGAGGDPPTTGAGPCGALSACCGTLDDSLRELCVIEQADAVSGGDAACEVLLLRYCPEG